MPTLSKIEQEQFIRVLSDPVSWVHTFLKDPRDPQRNISLRSYQQEVLNNTRKEKYIVLRFGRRCLPGSMPVLLSDGTKRPIKDIVIGDEVTTRDTLGQFRSRVVTDTYNNGEQDIYSIRLANGKEIQCTSNHLLAVSNTEWKSMEDGLSVGDKVQTKKKDRVSLSTIKSIKCVGKHATYDITVEEDHNFIVNTIITHNSGKTVVICCDCFWWCIAQPLVKMYEENGTKQVPYKVLILTPMDSQIKEIFDTFIALMEASPFIKGMVTKIKRSDVHEIRFNNGSKIKGMTIGISTANKGLSARGQGGNYLFLDECDYVPRDVMDQAILPISTDNPDVKIRACSTPSGKREIFYNWCFPKSTQVNTPAGLKDIETIELNDTVFGIDGKPDKVVKLYKQFYKGNLSIIKTSSSITKCTPNHEIYTYDKGFVKARNIHKGDYLLAPKEIYPKSPIKIDTRSFYSSADYQRINLYNRFKELDNKTEASLAIYGNKHGRRMFHYYDNYYKEFGDELWAFDKRRRDSLITAQQFLDDIYNSKIDMKSLYKLLGYYLAEGNILKNTLDTGAYYSGLQFTFNENEIEYINEVKSLVKKLFPKTRILTTPKRDDHSTSIFIYRSWISYVFITLCGEYSHKKNIHNSLMHYTDYTLFLLETFINGDGHLDPCGNYSMTTVSCKLSKQLHSISIFNNIPCSVYKVVRPKENHHDAYIIRQLSCKRKYRIKNNKLYYEVTETFSSTYNDYVYNLETERTHTYNVDSICTHNCTSYNKLGWWHLHIPSWHKDNENWLSIEQAKEQGIPITESTEYQRREGSTADAYAREYGAEFGEELGGVYKHDHINSSLVKYCREYNTTDVDLFDPDFEQNPRNLYIMGVDWNTYKHGGQVVIVEYCVDPTFIKYFDDTSNEDVVLNCTNKFRLFYRRGVKVFKSTQRATRAEIIRLLKAYKIDHVYVDYGAGDTNIEELSFYGKDHPELGIGRKLHVIDSGSVIEHYDPILRQMVKKRAKSMMINMSVVSLEENRMLLPLEEDSRHRLVEQMRTYMIKTVTAKGDFTYEGPDHILDAFNLAIYGFHHQYSTLLVTRTDNHIKFMDSPRLDIAPLRKLEASSPIGGKMSYPTVDPEKINNFNMPMFRKTKYSRNSNTLGSGFRKTF